jgi:hypothetical protein
MCVDDLDRVLGAHGHPIPPRTSIHLHPLLGETFGMAASACVAWAAASPGVSLVLDATTDGTALAAVVSGRESAP